MVQFDFDGALAMARALWATADAVAVERNGVNEAAATALVDFEGRHADSFVQYHVVDQETLLQSVGLLRVEADEWAVHWADAMNRLNEERRAVAVAARNAVVANLEEGELEPPPIRQVVPASPPQSPDYAPTAEPQHF